MANETLGSRLYEAIQKLDGTACVDEEGRPYTLKVTKSQFEDGWAVVLNAEYPNGRKRGLTSIEAQHSTKHNLNHCVPGSASDKEAVPRKYSEPDLGGDPLAEIH